jgi:hypothetical protein
MNWSETFDISLQTNTNPYDDVKEFCAKCRSDLGFYLKLRVWYNGTDDTHCDAHTYHCTVPSLFEPDLAQYVRPIHWVPETELELNEQLDALYEREGTSYVFEKSGDLYGLSDLKSLLSGNERNMSEVLEDWYYAIFLNMIQCAEDKRIDTIVLPMLGLEHHVPQACDPLSTSGNATPPWWFIVVDPPDWWNLSQLFGTALYRAIIDKEWDTGSNCIVLSAASYYHGESHSTGHYKNYAANMKIFHSILVEQVEERLGVEIFTVGGFLEEGEEADSTFMYLLKRLTEQNRPTDRLMLVNGICGRRVPGFYHDVDEARIREFSEYTMSATDNDFGRYTSIHLFGWAVTNPRLQQNIRWVP